MKKILFALLAAVMVLALAACGSSKNTDFEEITALDNDDCTIRITGVEISEDGDYILHTYLENKSDTPWYFFTNSDVSAAEGSEDVPSGVYMNGLQDSSYMDVASSVKSGKSTEADLTVWSAGLMTEDVSEIKVTFYVFGSDNKNSSDGDPIYTAEATVSFAP